MNLLKLRKLSELNNSIIAKMSWAGFLIFGTLSFCFSQHSSAFSKELEAAEAIWTEKGDTAYFKALELLKSQYVTHLDTSCTDKADLYRNLGVHIFHNQHYEAALHYIQDTALQIALNCPTIDYEVLTRIYTNIISIHLSLDQTHLLPPIIERLRWHLEEDKAGPIVHQANIQSVISRYYQMIGDFDQAIIWNRSSIANHNKLPLSEVTLRAYLEFAYILHDTKEYEHALTMYDSTRQLAQNLGLMDTPQYNENIIYNKASCYEGLGQYEEALHYNQVYALMTDPKDVVIQSDIANLKAYISFSKKNYKEALAHIQESIGLSIESNDDYQLLGLGEDHIFESRIHLALGNYKEATKSALDALKTTVVDAQRLDDHSFKFSLLFIKDANAFNKAAHQIFNSIVHYEKEENIISFADQLDLNFFSLQTYFSGDISTSEVIKRHHSFCEALLKYIFDHHLEYEYSELTAYYISTSKALSLLEELSLKKGVPQELKSEFFAINEEWTDIQSQLEIQQALQNTTLIDSLAKRNFDLNIRREQLNEKLSTLHLVPDFRKFRHSLITHAQSQLRPAEAIVEFFYGSEYIYSYYIDATDVAFASRKIHPLLESNFIPAFSSTESPDLQKYDERIDSISRYFEGFFQKIDNSINEITLIQDGKLLYFPFDILKVNNKSLIDQASIHYQFSHSISDFQRIKNGKAICPYAGFAMGYNDDIIQDIIHSRDIYKLYQDSFDLGILPSAIEEVRLAQETFSGAAFLNEACTREVFFREAGDCQILHIANHALLNENNSDLSSIVFAKGGEADLVNVIDIKKLDLNADLTILSSCNSGRGEHVAGNGLKSLGLSFAEAGCPSILVNLWDASDKSTKQIITSFLLYIKEGLSKSHALQKAKQDYIQSAPGELRHPKYWAGMVLIGDDAPMQLRDDSNYDWKVYLLIIVSVFILVSMVARFRQGAT